MDTYWLRDKCCQLASPNSVDGEVTIGTARWVRAAVVEPPSPLGTICEGIWRERLDDDQAPLRDDQQGSVTADRDEGSSQTSVE